MSEWKKLPNPPFKGLKPEDMVCFERDGLSVIITAPCPYDMPNGRQVWQHISFSRKDKIPTYADKVAVKERFAVGNCYAVEIHPPKSEHVNIHNFCLHLWVCLEGYPLPDFTMGSGMI